MPSSGVLSVIFRSMLAFINEHVICRGVWLDRGELDKIIERSAAPPAQEPTPELSQRGYRDHKSQPDDRWGQGHRRKSWLSDIFD
ncbi:MAG: zf-TFIIB domain-containing protein [Pseudomonadota bacterium]